ncbi:T9SS type A sorting domain-containing protein [candidate division WOR-3 bacterium]|nr:T9SS type A sorting domain-containing protein [candidate division WOR-3 bacterium]
MNRLLLTFSVVFLFLSVSFVSGQNLLQNPGFEDWTGDSCHYWDTETTAFDLYQESGTIHSGTYSAKLILRSTSTQRFTQYVYPVNPGNDYEGSIWCYDNEPFGRARLYIRWYDGSGSWISSFFSSYSVDYTEWQQLTAGPSAAPAAAETAHVEIRLYSVGTPFDSAVFYVDDASFVDLGPGQPPETLTIYEIQGQATSSPWEDSSVVTYGIVTGVFGNHFFIEEQPGGAWHGIYVYGSSTTPNRGDSIRVTGVVTEYFGMTELTGPIVDVLSTGVTLPGPTVLPTGSVSVEDYESVLARVEDATCTNDSLGYGEWELDDNSGPVRVDDMGVSYVPDSGQIYTVIGPVMYSYGDFKMEPRDSNDIIEGGGISEISKITKEFTYYIFPTISSKSVRINLTANKSTHTEVSIFSITGRKITTLFSENLKKGEHTILWNGTTTSGEYVPSGIYFVKARMGEKTVTKKVSILR